MKRAFTGLVGRPYEPDEPKVKPVAKVAKPAKGGRPPIKGAAMTAGERKKRQRALAPVRRIIKEMKKIEEKVSAHVFHEIFVDVRERIRHGVDERTIMEILKLIRQQTKDDHAKHRPQGFFMKDAPAGKGLLLTGEYTGEKLALIDAYQDPGWDGEKSTFGLATKKKPVLETRKGRRVS